MSDPEVAAKATRRRFTAAYKLSIIKEADACETPGEIRALLRREGLYSSHLSAWRKAAREGTLQELARHWRRRCSRLSRGRGFAGRSRTGAMSTGSFSHKGVTRQLLWLEYREVHTNGDQYSWFCERYKAGGDASTWCCGRSTGRARRRSSTMPAPVVDRGTGEVRDAIVFVGVPLETFYVQGQDGRRIAAYRFGNPGTQNLASWVAVGRGPRA